MALAEDRGVELSELPLAAYQTIHPAFGADVHKVRALFSRAVRGVGWGTFPIVLRSC